MTHDTMLCFVLLCCIDEGEVVKHHVDVVVLVGGEEKMKSGRGRI